MKPGYVLPLLFQIVLLIFPAISGSQGKAYRIGPNDVLTLTIHAGGEKQHEGNLTVSADGTINAPFIGAIKAEGLTPSQLEKQITEPLATDYFVNPKVNIYIKEYHSLHYYITGAVEKPGLYEMTTEASLLELIAKAEGVSLERGNVAYIMRSSADEVISGEKVEDLASRKEPIKVDLQRLLDRGDMSVNLILEPGDVVYIPLKKALDLAVSKIYVEGEVKKPGLYDYQPGMTAMNACIMAGGFDRFAAPNRTRIIRKKGKGVEIIKINLNRVKEGKIPDIELKPGDRLHVPETWL
ncbi:MAG: polysaccharide biosynthesis/export family protein [Deltaproteobacteria bacterium]|nr:polysaccharide biosynthesis/export family protein [Deltaproteobacteria bacterium]MBW1910124.1 polysaccharide biosynthesis/export family protein [Deltaproteobacteria bacterium]MBW2032980.1 polysaccharide biosynthesis/export family protein [Deltaproteobacteria bacterium]